MTTGVSSSRLLVTGGAGFIGSNFVHYWLREHPEDRVVVLDALTYAGNLQNLTSLEHEPRFRFVHADIRDLVAVTDLMREEDIETIVHFAAESHVDRSISGPDLFLDVNILGSHCLLKAARELWLDQGDPSERRFHHVSTDEVYGSLEPDDAPFVETTPYAPNSPYAASKAASDHLVRAYHRTYGLPTTISNCSNNYGPYQFPEKLIPLAIVRLLEGGRVPIYGDGLNVRDWLFVEDHCAGIDRVLREGRAGQTYNLGGNAETTNLALIRSLCRLVDVAFGEQPTLADRFPHAWAARGEGSETAIEYVVDRAGHDRRYAIDSSRAEREVGFSVRTTFEDGLARTLAWYLDNEPWWRALETA